MIGRPPLFCGVSPNFSSRIPDVVAAALQRVAWSAHFGVHFDETAAE